MSEPADRMHPELAGELLASTAPRQAVVVAVSDQFHYEIVKQCLQHNQHVLCVKPLVLKYEQSAEIEKLALPRVASKQCPIIFSAGRLSALMSRPSIIGSP